MHRNPEYFPDPERFNPDRFSPEREKCIPCNAYLPFGIGAYICIGNHFAMLEAHPLIATIFQHVNLELLTKENIQPYASQGLALRPDHNVMMKIHKF